jgi:hypothetical protein
MLVISFRLRMLSAASFSEEGVPRRPESSKLSSMYNSDAEAIVENNRWFWMPWTESSFHQVGSWLTKSLSLLHVVDIVADAVVRS